MGRMQRVDRPPIKPNIKRIAVQLDKAFAGIVTRLTQALQLTKEELVWVTAMRLDVIRDARRHPVARTRRTLTRVRAPARGHLPAVRTRVRLSVRKSIRSNSIGRWLSEASTRSVGRLRNAK